MELRKADVINDIKTYPDYFFNIIFSDPPYNLGSTIYIDDDGKMKFKGKATDFMNKWEFGSAEWEQFMIESFRVLKHGGFCLLFGMDRQLALIQYYAVAAGFKIQQSLYWYFISSMTKSTDISKRIDKRLGLEREVVGFDKLKYRKIENHNQKCYSTFNQQNADKKANIDNPTPPLAKKYSGYKYSVSPFKQVLETIMVFRKPVKTSVIDDIMTADKDCSPAVINVDGGRVGTQPRLTGTKNLHAVSGIHGIYGKDKRVTRQQEFDKRQIETGQGRYPSQLFIDKKAGELIDRQSGESVPDNRKQLNQTVAGWFDSGNGIKTTFQDSGGASRILHKCDYETEEIDLIKYSPKVSGKERNLGCNGDPGNYSHDGRNKHIENPYQRHDSVSRNTHPTLKPIKLIKHILTLFKLPIPQNIYIPFAGAGSEIIGAQKAGFENIYACELSKEYIEIAKARIKFWQDHDIEKEITEPEDIEGQGELF